MLSGIGKREHLSSFGIKTVVNLPAVGTNLQDHVFLGNSWLVNANFTLDDLHRNTTLASEQLQVWEANGTGLMGLPPSNQFGWFRADPSVFKDLNATDPSAGPTSANFELIISVRAECAYGGNALLIKGNNRTTSPPNALRYPPRDVSSP